MSASRLPWILLVVSLAFNVAFAAGFVHTRLTADRPTPPAGDQDRAEEGADSADEMDPRLRLVSELNLDAGQLEQFERAYERSQQRSDELRDELREIREQMLELRGADEPDRERLGELRSRAREVFETLAEERQSQFNEFMQTLTPEQRRAAVELMRSRGGRHHRAISPEQRERMREAFRKRLERRRERADEDADDEQKPGRSPDRGGPWPRRDFQADDDDDRTGAETEKADPRPRGEDDSDAEGPVQ